MDLPPQVGRLAGELSSLPGVVAVALSGSRAVGTARPDSDWDLCVYYRGTLDPSAVRALGYEGFVSEVGEWGPIMNGGAWLTVDGLPVDVLYRDLDVIERWTRDVARGEFEVLVQNGSVVGSPTYAPVGELATCVPLHGDLPRPDYPPALAESAARRWTGRAAVSLMFARTHAAAGDEVACTGMLADAVLSVAHALMAERGEWVVNEKRLVARAGLTNLPPLRVDQVEAVAAALGVAPLSAR